MKKWLCFFAFLVGALCVLCLPVAAFDIQDITPPASAQKLVYGQSGAGRELVAYRFGEGENVLVAGFAIHGYEDNFDKDGGVLVFTADRLMRQLEEHQSLLEEYDWTVYVLPCMNPDGLMDGNSCDGAGRCTTTYIDDFDYLRTGQGIDLNRSFPQNWQKHTEDRNFNGNRPLAAIEARALADFLQDVKGRGRNLCIDVHGWYQQIITFNDTEGQLFPIFSAYFPDTQDSGSELANGYFSAYAASLGYISCLFEFPEDVDSLWSFIREGYDTSFNACILALLEAYGSRENSLLRILDYAVPWAWYQNRTTLNCLFLNQINFPGKVDVYRGNSIFY